MNEANESLTNRKNASTIHRETNGFFFNFLYHIRVEFETYIHIPLMDDETTSFFSSNNNF